MRARMAPPYRGFPTAFTITHAPAKDISMSSQRIIMQPSFSLAIPSIVLEDCSTLREKTEKIGTIARAAAIFAVPKICIYGVKNRSRDETKLLKLMLQYLELPQYLRKKLYPISEELRFAGLLPPLRIPSHLVHADISKVKVGDVREGIAIRREGVILADVGLQKLVSLSSDVQPGSRVTVRIESIGNTIPGKPISRKDVGFYWGYSIETYSTLSEMFQREKPAFTILTSKQGDSIKDRWGTLQERIRNASDMLVVFGSPKHGLPEILSREHIQTDNSMMLLNTIPSQAVETVRTEEAILATLSILNLARS